jgi:hypothetical protein
LYDHLAYFTAIGNIFGHLLYLVVIWYILPHFGILSQEKSGNLGPNAILGYKDPLTGCDFNLLILF